MFIDGRTLIRLIA